MVAPRASIVFRTAAGARIGYGHLVRTTVLGRALGMTPVVSVRGTDAARRAATAMGCRLADGAAARVLAGTGASLVVIDDPSSRASQPWARAAMRQGVRVATIHDLGLAPCDTHLAVDGSIVRTRPRPVPSLLGPRYLILAAGSAVWREPARPCVLIALGGGPRRRAALTLARAIRAQRPDVVVRIAGGLDTRAPGRLPEGVTWLGPQPGLGAELAAASAAVVGGGVSLYEACRVGTPAVGVAVVAGQRPTIAGLASRRAVVDGGTIRDLETTARRVVRLLGDAGRRARLSRAGRSVVDGRGAVRVAGRLQHLARLGRVRHFTGASR